MRFYIYTSICNQDFAKYSKVLFLTLCLFAEVVWKLNCRMTMQSPVVTFWRNTNLKCDENSQIFISNSKTSTALEDKPHSGDLEQYRTKFYQTERNRTKFYRDILLSYRIEKCDYMLDNNEKYEVLNLNHSLIRRITKKRVVKKHGTFSDLKNSPKFSLCDVFMRDEDNLNNIWAGWKQAKTSISNQSKPLVGELSVLSVANKQFIAHDVCAPRKTADCGLSFGNKIPGSLKEVDTIVSKNDVLKLRAKVFKLISSILHAKPPHSVEKHISHPLESVIPKRVLSITEEESNIQTASQQNLSKTRNVSRSSNEHEKSPLKRGTVTEISEIGMFPSEKTLSALILSIMQDDSCSDLKNLEDEVNRTYCPLSADVYLGVKTSDGNSKSWGYKGVNIPDDYMPQSELKEYSCNENQKAKRGNKESGLFDELCPATRRSRVDSKDSGIDLDSSFEEKPAEKSDSVEDASFSACKTAISEEFVSGANSLGAPDIDDSEKVCVLCQAVIISMFFLTNSYGLLLNCWHSFCYSCIRNHCKTQRLGTGLVECPKCGESSPGIVSSRRWIKDQKEKTALFLEYETESKVFHKQQQVFSKTFLI